MKTTRSTLLLLFSVFLTIGCGSSQQSGEQTGSKTVDAEELKALLQDNVRLIDVRTPNEYAGGRIQGATLINYRDKNFRDQISKLDKDVPVAIYCAAGGRSTRATDMMIELGFGMVYNYTGGFSDWRSRGEPIETE